MNSKNQIDKLKGNLKKRNYKAFFFFIVFTLFIWLFVQMSKVYNHQLDLQFHIENVPKSLILEQTDQTLSAQIKQSGFKILAIHLFNSSVDVDFNQLDSTANQYEYDLIKHKAEITKTLKLSSEDLTFAQDTLSFDYYVLTTRKLKIKSALKVNFGKGFDSLTSFKFDPSYIEVSGNDSILKALDYVATEEKTFDNVSDTLSGQIDIQKIDSLSVNYLTEKINFTLPVAKFTEGTFEIPIEFENPELNEQLLIFPKTVKVNFKTSLSNYERIDESGFKVIAKYKPDDQFMFLELFKKPKYVKSVSLENYKVDYLIKK
ncbi:hypothetical protein [Psychroflexus tropicus]|uniref:hypothetical protein n=1 Tax=Psychroflexus tropicus TaxID=197345 RepID=UPI000363CAAC|nr:hypothetical protein [Psychroflexus tropicus]